MPAPLPLVLALLSALLLPSCVQWNIGARIRESSAVHVGADVTNSVVRYYRPGHEYGADYLLAPEVTYKALPPIAGFRSDSHWAKNVQPTGRLVLVDTGLYNKGDRRTTRVESLPLGLRAVRSRAGQGTPGPLEFPLRTGDFESPLARPASTASRIAAAPFDYVVDPVLSTVNTVIVAVPIGCALVVAAPLALIWPELLP